MNEEKIKQTEVDLLSTAIERIITSEVLENIMSDNLPTLNELSDSNKTYSGKVSILFVDMRESTKLPEKFNQDQLVKIYRSYIRTVVQAIRYSGGVVRDFMGDGVLSVFVDSEKEGSEDKAVQAARYITTSVDKILNPILDKYLKHRISCGIGIYTGNVTVSKVGMKGKEQDPTAENEYGIAWIGNCTNLASKYSGAVKNGDIFISSSTYSALSDLDSKQNWTKIEISKGSNLLSGYIAKQYYLGFDAEIEPCQATSGHTNQNFADWLSNEYKKQLSDIASKSVELGKKEKELSDKENEVNRKAKELTHQNKCLSNNKISFYNDVYYFHCDVLGSGHCKAPYVIAMGKDFWEEHLSEAIKAGAKIGKTEHKVKQDVSYAMVSIYEDLGIYDKAYDFLVEQASGCSWLHLYTVQNIVKKVGYCSRLKDAISFRLVNCDLSPEDKKDFETILDWLVIEYA